MVILIPFCLILSANLLNYLDKHSKILTYVLLCLIVLSNLLIFLEISRALLSKIDSIPDFPSSNIYQLTEYLQKNEIYRPISIIDNTNTGVCLNLQLLSSGRIRPFELNLNNYGQSYFTDTLRKEFLVQDNMFIIHPLGLSPNMMGLTEDIIRDLNKTMVINKTFDLGGGYRILIISS